MVFMLTCTKVIEVYVSCVGSITFTTAVIIYVYIDLITPPQPQLLHHISAPMINYKRLVKKIDKLRNG